MYRDELNWSMFGRADSIVGSLRKGMMIIPVLKNIWGKKYDGHARCSITMLQPSVIDVFKLNDHGVRSAMPWRVSVYLSQDEKINRIEQEVEILLADDWTSGKDAEEYLNLMSGENNDK